MSFRTFMKKAEKDREREAIIDEINATVRHFQKNKDSYAQKIKEGLKKGDDSAVSMSLAMMKNAMFNLKQAEDMMVNMQMLYDAEKMQKLNRRFVRSMDSISKNILAECRGVSASNSQKLFGKAIGKHMYISEQLKELMKKNNLVYRSSINNVSEIDDNDILDALKAELAKDGGNASIDEELEKIEKELNIKHGGNTAAADTREKDGDTSSGGATPPAKKKDKTDPNVPRKKVSNAPTKTEEDAPEETGENEGAGDVYKEPRDGAEESEPETKDSAAEFTPDSLDSFIGQTHIVERIKAEINAARRLNRLYLDNILLFGNRGLGKTTLMKLIAKELGVEFKFLDCSSLTNDVASQRRIQRFLMEISRKNEPVVIGFDEIHALPNNIQTCLLTLLNDRVYSYIDDNGCTHSIKVNAFTFIGATTDSDKVLNTIKDRCHNLTFYMQDYTEDELHRIFQKKFHALGLEPTEETYAMCVNRCRSSIREVEAFVKGMQTIAINRNSNIIDKDVAQTYFDQTETDCLGLREKDRQILKILCDDPSGIMSADTLAAKAHIDVKVLVSEFEPYLLKAGLIQIFPRGRSITEKGRAHIRSVTDGDSSGDNR